jgi:hypothetical protein
VGRATPVPPPPPRLAEPDWPVTAPQPIVVVPRQRRSGMTVLLIVVGVFAACCAVGATVALVGSAAFRHAAAPARPAAPSPSPRPTRTTQPPPTQPANPGLKDAVRDGKFEFVVSKVSCGHNSIGKGPVKKQPQGQYCIVSLTVTNISTHKQVFSDSYQNAIGDDGNVYGADTAAGVIENENGSAVFNTINPGNEVSAKIVYDIPDSASIAKLELHDSPFSGGVTISLNS